MTVKKKDWISRFGLNALKVLSTSDAFHKHQSLPELMMTAKFPVVYRSLAKGIHELSELGIVSREFITDYYCDGLQQHASKKAKVIIPKEQLLDLYNRMSILYMKFSVEDISIMSAIDNLHQYLGKKGVDKSTYKLTNKDYINFLIPPKQPHRYTRSFLDASEYINFDVKNPVFFTLRDYNDSNLNHVRIVRLILNAIAQ